MSTNIGFDSVLASLVLLVVVVLFEALGCGGIVFVLSIHEFGDG